MVHQPLPHPGPGWVYLDVPYGEKDEAKQAGARWDPKVRRWYDPKPNTPGLQRWAARPEVPEVLPGENRTFAQGLFVDLVPSSCWFTNVRSCVADADWERLRRPILRRAQHRCEACGTTPDPGPRAGRAGRGLEVHERWHYDNQSGVQALRRLVALCPSCHTATHYGLAELTGHAETAFAHLCAVTGMTPEQAHAHIADAIATWKRRSDRVWELDLNILTQTGIELRRPPEAAQRAEVAVQELGHLRPVDAAADNTANRGGGTDAGIGHLPTPAPPEPPPASALSQTPARPVAGGTTDVGWVAAVAGEAWHGTGEDLAGNAPGIGITHEAAHRRHSQGLGADRSWRVGADGEATVGQVLAGLATPTRLDRLRGRPAVWKVLHSVPVGTGRGDIDHVLIGPPGLVTINTKHHRAGRLSLDGDELVVNGRRTDYIPKARREAEHAHHLLTTALTATGHNTLAEQLQVRPVLAVVGGRVLITRWAPGVPVVMTRQLLHTLTSMPTTLDPTQIDTVYALARHRAVWTRPTA